MKWRDSSLILGARRFGEQGLILSVLCSDMGRQAGLVSYGASRKNRPLYEAGNVVECEWTGRLEVHLGRFTVADIIQTNANHLLHRPFALKALSSVISLLRCCTDEGDRSTARLYEPTLALLTLIKADEADAHWPAAYARWEYKLLECLGFALDLESCAVSGDVGEMAYISPKTGRGVTEDAALKSGYLSQLLRLPSFLVGHNYNYEYDCGDVSLDVIDALKLTGHFLQARHFDNLHNYLPEPRRALLEALDGLAHGGVGRESERCSANSSCITAG